MPSDDDEFDIKLALNSLSDDLKNIKAMGVKKYLDFLDGILVLVSVWLAFKGSWFYAYVFFVAGTPYWEDLIAFWNKRIVT